MAYLVKVTGVVNGVVLYAEKSTGKGTKTRGAAQQFGYGQALEVASTIQKAVGKNATVEVEPV